MKLDEGVKLSIHIVFGHFWINGKPLSVMPDYILKHPHYFRLFGDEVFTVHTKPEEYTSESKESECYFTFQYYPKNKDLSEGTLLIKEYAKKGKEERQLINEHALKDFLPLGLVENYSHWWIPSKKKVAFRPKCWRDPNFSSEEYEYELSTEDYLLTRNFPVKKTLLNRKGHNFEILFEQIFGRIASPEHVHIFVISNQQLEVYLPKLSIHFDICQTERGPVATIRELGDNGGMIVASNQYIGTLIGNKGFLRLKGSNEDKLLVPFESEHKDSPPYFLFDINPHLRKLQTTTPLGWMYLALLHVRTSRTMKDPFTGMTGLESAFLCLRRCQTNRPFDNASLNVLKRIISLSPHREVYKFKELGLERVKWSPPSTASHDSLGLLAAALITHSFQLSSLFPDSSALPESVYNDLSIRALWRWQSFYPPSVWLSPEEKKLVGADESKFQEITFHSFDSWRPTAERVLSIDGTELFHLRSFVELGGEFAPCQEVLLQPSKYVGENWTETPASAFLTLYGKAKEITKEEFLSFRLLVGRLAQKWNAPKGYFSFFLDMACHPHDFPPLPNDLKNEERSFTYGRYTFSKSDVNSFSVKREYSKQECLDNLWNHFLERAPLKDCVPTQSKWERTYFLESYKFEKDPMQALCVLYTNFYFTKKFCDFIDSLVSLLPRNGDESEVIPPLHCASVSPPTHLNIQLFSYEDPVVETSSQAIEEEKLMESGQDRELEDLFRECCTIGLEETTHSEEEKIRKEMADLDEEKKTLKEEHEDEYDELPRYKEIKKRKKVLGKRQKEIQSKRSETPSVPFPLNISTDSNIGQTFSQQLEESWQQHHALSSSKQLPELTPKAKEKLKEVKKIAKEKVELYWNKIEERFQPPSRIDALLKRVGLFPSVVPQSVLPLFSTHSCTLLGAYGIYLTYLQKAERCLSLLELLKPNSTPFEQSKVLKEIRTIRTWSPKEYPTWLLFEIEQDLLIREVQKQVALEMMNLTDTKKKSNRVYQLNMGEGKTSVIIPILCAHLADGSKSVRVTVLSSLFETNYDDLSSRLGGLLQRSMYTFTTSRDTNFDETILHTFLEQLKEAKEKKRCILMLPEHQLSFLLKRLELLKKKNSKEEPIVSLMDDVISWFETNVTDLLDESDELLKHKYQLIYPMGAQQSVGGGEKRWKIMQDILKIVHSLSSKFANNSFEYHSPPKKSMFPSFRIIETSAMPRLVKEIGEEIMKGQASSLKFSSRRTEEKEKLRDCILKADLGDLRSILEEFKELEDEILITRGILSFDILLFGLQKRWSVDYGINLHNPLKRMAVPFRAKDTASERTEFGHPDIAILLTHLSYYYMGLSKAQIEDVFSCVKSDEYNSWVALDHEEIQEAGLADFQAVNKADPSQMAKIFELFRRNILTINFWLNLRVFPSETKQFPEKLVANAWDLAMEKTHPIRGFSGTNDNRLLLPLSIQQHDLNHLIGTNGQVLSFMLKKENSQYTCLKSSSGSEILKEILGNGKGKVLIDCGALMVEMSNRRVIEEWMTIDTEAQGGIFFENNHLMALDRHGICLPFLLSPLRQRLGHCVTYLDDPHTRGTDIKFPIGTHAYVTLGPKMPKDKLVQACMRMRQLGVGHTVSFWSPREVDIAIRQRIEDQKQISSKEVLEFCVQNTITGSEEAMVHWARQGLRFSQCAAGKKFYDSKKENYKEKMITANTLPEVLELRKFYGEARQQRLVIHVVEREKIRIDALLAEHLGHSSSPELKFSRKIQEEIVEKAKEFVSDKKTFGRQLDEEQERELEQEEEEERQISRPPPEIPLKPKTHPCLSQLLHEIPKDFQQHKEWRSFLLPLGESFKQTEFGKLVSDDVWDTSLRVTPDFISTIEGDIANYYLKPPSHMVLVPHIPLYVIVSPFEANFLASQFHKKKSTGESFLCHLAPFWNPLQEKVFFSVSPFEWKMSPQVEIQLNVFAGSIWFNDFDELLAFCGLLPPLRFPNTWSRLADKNIVDNGGFVRVGSENCLEELKSIPEDEKELIRRISKSKFTKSPAKFLEKVVHYRHSEHFLKNSEMKKLLP